MAMRLYFVVSLFVLSLCSIHAQLNTHYGARSAGMAHASVTLSDVWSSHHNQAGLAWLEQSEAGVFVQNRFLMKELNYGGFAYAHKLNTGALAVSYSNFGYQLFGESKVGLGYGMKFTNMISGGVQLNYHHIRLANNYGQNSALTAELGLQTYLTDKIMLAAHLFNPTRTALNEFNKEKIPTIMRLGMNYIFSKQVLATIEAEKDIDMKPVFRMGLEYKTSNKFYLRGGIGTQPTLAAFGFGLYTGAVKLDVAASYHQVLGFTPDISFIYQIKKVATPSAVNENAFN
jgi:hypothetical protein